MNDTLGHFSLIRRLWITGAVLLFLLLGAITMRYFWQWRQHVALDQSIAKISVQIEKVKAAVEPRVKMPTNNLPDDQNLSHGLLAIHEAWPRINGELVMMSDWWMLNRENRATDPDNKANTDPVINETAYVEACMRQIRALEAVLETPTFNNKHLEDGFEMLSQFSELHDMIWELSWRLSKRISSESSPENTREIMDMLRVISLIPRYQHVFTQNRNAWAFRLGNQSTFGRVLHLRLGRLPIAHWRDPKIRRGMDKARQSLWDLDRIQIEMYLYNLAELQGADEGYEYAAAFMMTNHFLYAAWAKQPLGRLARCLYWRYHSRALQQLERHGDWLDWPVSTYHEGSLNYLMEDIGSVHSSMETVGRLMKFVLTDCEMLRAFFAIKRYEADQGRKPDSLKQLMPDYLTELPIDYTDAARNMIRYAPEKNLVYAIDLDGEDNGGDTRYDKVLSLDGRTHLELVAAIEQLENLTLQDKNKVNE